MQTTEPPKTPETTHAPGPQGLTSAEIPALRARYGWNELPDVRKPSMAAVLLRQFRGLLVLILIVAAAIAATLGETLDAVAIGLVLMLNAILGFVQEWRAETALEALRGMMSPEALVVRDGTEQVVPARDLVPGDRVIVSGGDTIPADLDMAVGIEAAADESALTGESVPVDKMVDGSEAERQLHAGTTLVRGRAEGIVIATGAATEFGRIADLTGSVEEKQTNLQTRLGQLAAQLGVAAVLIGLCIVGLGVLLGRPLFEMFMTGLSLAVAIVPEGLPAVVTITLALGASAMVRRRALARRLQAVETLGAASVICSDKTGTITENQMTVTSIWTPGATYAVTGAGYDPTGHIAREGRRIRASDDPVLAALLQTATVCNHATLSRDGAAWRMTGTPTEGALITLAYKGWSPLPHPGDRVAEHPFASERKMMAMLARDAQGLRLHVKGAPETVLPLCTGWLTSDDVRPLTPESAAAAHAAYEAMASDGQRVIALAARPAAHDADLEESDLALVGLLGLIDPPRPEVSRAIDAAREAGIRVVMITGDSPSTAAAVARDVGLGEPAPLLGRELDEMDDATLTARLGGDVLFARTRPEHKIRIVRALQELGQIVAMTGDGVNDAPALRQADIGIAMGGRGTDVSRNASDLVLLDDNFATIVGAIAEGRRQFDNVRKFVRYLLSSNAGEVIAIVANLALGGPLVLLATQILWTNLITDGVTAVALGLERGEPDQMKRPPRGIDEPIVGLPGLGLIAIFGLYTGGASLWLFYDALPLGVDVARTAAFTGLVFFEMVSVFAFRSLTQPNREIGWASNRVLLGTFAASLVLQVAAVYWTPLQLLLSTAPLGAQEWGRIVALSLPLIVLPEAAKSLRRR